MAVFMGMIVAGWDRLLKLYILLVCAELDLLGGTHFSLDGVKLSSNAPKECSGTFKELKRIIKKLLFDAARAIHAFHLLVRMSYSSFLGRGFFQYGVKSI